MCVVVDVWQSYNLALFPGCYVGEEVKEPGTQCFCVHQAFLGNLHTIPPH